MKRILAVVLTVAFVMSLFAGAVYAQDLQEGSITVDGWGSYTSTGDAPTAVYPVTYFNRDSQLMVQVNIENRTGANNTFGGFVRVYHYNNAATADLSVDNPTADSPVGHVGYHTAQIIDGEEQRHFVRVRITSDVYDPGEEADWLDLHVAHSLFADADHEMDAVPPLPPFIGD